jgi:hypothetical protein
VIAVKNETHDYHNDENDVESKGQKNRTTFPPSPPSIQLSMEGILPLEETVLGS